MTAYSQPHSSQPIAEAIVADIAHYVDDVVICPGSRNSALSLALIARPDVRVHVRIDERSAAFLAVGDRPSHWATRGGGDHLRHCRR